MGYDVHITRKAHWSDDDDGSQISQAEWEAYIASDPEMRLDGYAEAKLSGGDVLRVEDSSMAVWIGHPLHGQQDGMAWIYMFRGVLAAKNPDQAFLRKLWSIAQALGARVQGDDGEFYDAEGNCPGQAALPAKPPGHHRPRGQGGVLLQRAVIFALAGLLVFYHTYTLFELYVGSGRDFYGGPTASGHPLYMHTQSVLRLLIIVSLVLVAMNGRTALYGMWVAIGALVATHYWAFFFELPFPFLEGRHPLSFLKGFIIPTVITLLYSSANSRRNLHGAA